MKGDPVPFRQVLLNIRGNAAKFTESGEIELSIDTEDLPENVTKLVCTVRDTGIGQLYQGILDCVGYGVVVKGEGVASLFEASAGR